LISILGSDKLGGYQTGNQSVIIWEAPLFGGGEVADKGKHD